jgi:hypothetical protein
MRAAPQADWIGPIPAPIPAPDHNGAPGPIYRLGMVDRRSLPGRQPRRDIRHRTDLEVLVQREAKAPQLVDVIRIAVQNVEQSSGVAPDDPAMVELKQNVVRTVGELEVAKAMRRDQDE